MLQGDSFNLPFKITREGTVLTTDDIADVEICIGKLNKKLSKGEVFYEAGAWYFPFTQQETFAYRNQKQHVQMRILFPSGGVKGFDLGYINVHKAMSEDILGVSDD